MSVINRDNFVRLKGLMAEKPHCKVFPIVAQNVCESESFYKLAFSLCKFGEPYVMKYCYYAMGGNIEEALYTEQDYDRVSDDIRSKGAEDVMWTEGIFVPINMSQEWELSEAEEKRFWINYYSRV